MDYADKSIRRWRRFADVAGAYTSSQSRWHEGDEGASARTTRHEGSTIGESPIRQSPLHGRPLAAAPVERCHLRNLRNLRMTSETRHSLRTRIALTPARVR